jgi:hypothetical protein
LILQQLKYEKDQANLAGKQPPEQKPAEAGGDKAGDENQNEPYIKKGTYCEFGFEGKRVIVPNSLKGLKIIAFLLEHPNKEYTPVEVLKEVGYIKEEDVFKQALTDTETIKAAKNKLAELNTQYESSSDFEEREELEEEIKKCKKYLNKTMNIRGRPRNTQDNYRLRVAKLIKGVFDKIEKDNAELYNHLDSFVKRGSIVGYKPDKLFNWTIL